ncbi:MAG: hypothetical protein HY329_23810 [Chloroflexi bacterium]|nr:hypothetical protein [Chloroflexota bacterium]
MIPEVGAVIALLTAAALSLKEALVRNGVTWALLIVGFVVVYLFLHDLPEAVLGAAPTPTAGGFVYLAYLSWQERKWGLAPSLAAAGIGVLLVGGVRLLGS